MNEALEALKELKWQIGNIHYFVKDDSGIPRETFLMLSESGLFDTIEQELKEYEGAKNHIEALNKERVENALKLKALEIIKNNFTITEQRQVQHKNLWNLTQEEWNLLKEMLL